MRVVVIGLGSMGRRRIRLMQTMAEAPEIVGVNRSAERRAQVEKEFGIRTFATLDEALAAAKPQAAFLCTAPASHGSAVMECIAAGLDIFMEINLLGGWYAEAAALAAAKGVKLFISSTPVYRREMRYIADAVRGEPVNYLYHCGQYLPDWHPWEDYHNFFAAKKETNGCREILCVELPWIEKAFGRIESVQVMSGRLTSLDIDFPDHYMISIRHAGGCKGMYCQDVVARKGLRRLEVFSEKIDDFSPISSLPNLVRFRGWKMDGGKMATALGDLSFLAPCKKLAKLELPGSAYSNTAVIGTLSGLEELDISTAKQPVDVSFVASLPNLKRLNVRGSEIVNGASIPASVKISKDNKTKGL